jgi:hypothetical protein
MADFDFNFDWVAKDIDKFLDSLMDNVQKWADARDQAAFDKRFKAFYIDYVRKNAPTSSKPVPFVSVENPGLFKEWRAAAKDGNLISSVLTYRKSEGLVFGKDLASSLSTLDRKNVPDTQVGVARYQVEKGDLKILFGNLTQKATAAERSALIQAYGGPESLLGKMVENAYGVRNGGLPSGFEVRSPDVKEADGKWHTRFSLVDTTAKDRIIASFDSPSRGTLADNDHEANKAAAMKDFLGKLKDEVAGELHPERLSLTSQQAASKEFETALKSLPFEVDAVAVSDRPGHEMLSMVTPEAVNLVSTKTLEEELASAGKPGETPVSGVTQSPEAPDSGIGKTGDVIGLSKNKDLSNEDLSPDLAEKADFIVQGEQPGIQPAVSLSPVSALEMENTPAHPAPGQASSVAAIVEEEGLPAQPSANNPQLAEACPEAATVGADVAGAGKASPHAPTKAKTHTNDIAETVAGTAALSAVALADELARRTQAGMDIPVVKEGMVDMGGGGQFVGSGGEAEGDKIKAVEAEPAPGKAQQAVEAEFVPSDTSKAIALEEAEPSVEPGLSNPTAGVDPLISDKAVKTEAGADKVVAVDAVGQPAAVENEPGVTENLFAAKPETPADAPVEQPGPADEQKPGIAESPAEFTSPTEKTEAAAEQEAPEAKVEEVARQPEVESAPEPVKEAAAEPVQAPVSNTGAEVAEEPQIPPVSAAAASIPVESVEADKEPAQVANEAADSTPSAQQEDVPEAKIEAPAEEVAAEEPKSEPAQADVEQEAVAKIEEPKVPETSAEAEQSATVQEEEQPDVDKVPEANSPEENVATVDQEEPDKANEQPAPEVGNQEVEPANVAAEKLAAEPESQAVEEPVTEPAEKVGPVAHDADGEASGVKPAENEPAAEADPAKWPNEGSETPSTQWPNGDEATVENTTTWPNKEPGEVAPAAASEPPSGAGNDGFYDSGYPHEGYRDARLVPSEPPPDIGPDELPPSAFGPEVEMEPAMEIAGGVGSMPV